MLTVKEWIVVLMLMLVMLVMLVMVMVMLLLLMLGKISMTKTTKHWTLHYYRYFCDSLSWDDVDDDSGSG
jgi:hypothetical protein